MSSSATVECPNCQARLRLSPDKIGKRIRCPKCAEPFTAQGDDEDFEDEVPAPVRRSKGKKSGPASAKKSKGGSSLLLVLGGGGAALVIVVGLVVYMSSSGKGPAPVAQADPATTAPPPPSHQQTAIPHNTPTPTNTGFPRALATLPDWLIKDAPFDAGKFWVTVPAEQNAAALYLDALYEFSPHVEVYFPQDVRAQRTSVVKARRDRSRQLQIARSQAPASPNPTERDAILNDHVTGFQKLKAAQTRPRCLFELGWDVPSFVPLVDAVREASRVAEMQIERDIEQGNFKSAIELIGVISRLSRDLRVRTPTVCQYTADGLDTTNQQKLLTAVLRSPRLTTADCDQLLQQRQQHIAELKAINPVLTGLQADYVWRQLLIHDLQNRTGEFADDKYSMAFGSTNASRGAALLAALNDAQNLIGIGPPDPPMIMMVDALITAMQPADYTRNIAWEQEYYRETSARIEQPFAARRESGQTTLGKARGEMQREMQKRVPENATPQQMQEATLTYLKSAFAEGTMTVPILAILLRNRFEFSMGGSGSLLEQDTSRLTNQQAAVALIALRRWYSTKTEPPADLSAVCSAAGLASVPVDEFSSGPLHLATFSVETPIGDPYEPSRKALAGESIVYSVGPDGRDDKALLSYGFQPGRPGDLLYPLGVSQSAFTAGAK